MRSMAKILYVKVGKVTTISLTNSKRKELVSGIKKYPVEKSFLTRTGFLEDEQADLLHHGGENKALFLFSRKTYDKINKECGCDFKIEEESYFGENLILSNVCEKDIYIGDIYEIGQSQIQITQPRQPCWKLSANTNKKEMTKFVFNSGCTGWYAKVLKEGIISKGDGMILVKREEEELSIDILNKLMLDPGFNEKLTQKAIESPFLGLPFKASLQKRYRSKEKDEQFKVYHT